MIKQINKGVYADLNHNRKFVIDNSNNKTKQISLGIIERMIIQIL